MKGFILEIYVVSAETSFNYRKFPWIKKCRGSITLKENMQTVVAENPEEAKKKWLELHPEIVSYPALNLLAAEGFGKFMCKDPNVQNKVWIRELNKKEPIGEYVQYMTPVDLALLKEMPVQNG